MKNKKLHIGILTCAVIVFMSLLLCSCGDRDTSGEVLIEDPMVAIEYTELISPTKIYGNRYILGWKVSSMQDLYALNGELSHKFDDKDCDLEVCKMVMAYDESSFRDQDMLFIFGYTRIANLYTKQPFKLERLEGNSQTVKCIMAEVIDQDRLSGTSSYGRKYLCVIGVKKGLIPDGAEIVVEQEKVFVGKEVQPVIREEGSFYTLREAYANGFITDEDVKNIAYYYNNRRDVFPPQPLDREREMAIKEAEVKRSADMDMTVDDVDIEYYGSYNGCDAVIIDNLLLLNPAGCGPTQEQVAGEIFEYDQEIIEIFK